MKKELIFHPEVAFDIKSSYDWYEKQLLGLGDRFLLDIEDGLELISNFPNSWANFHYNFKRYILNRFPFSIIYKITKKEIYIVAIMHNSKKPNSWTNRK